MVGGAPRLTPRFAPLLYCHSARVVYGVRFRAPDRKIAQVRTLPVVCFCWRRPPSLVATGSAEGRRGWGRGGGGGRPGIGRLGGRKIAAALRGNIIKPTSTLVEITTSINDAEGVRGCGGGARRGKRGEQRGARGGRREGWQGTHHAVCCCTSQYTGAWNRYHVHPIHIIHLVGFFLPSFSECVKREVHSEAASAPSEARAHTKTHVLCCISAAVGMPSSLNWWGGRVVVGGTDIIQQAANNTQ